MELVSLPEEDRVPPTRLRGHTPIASVSARGSPVNPRRLFEGLEIHDLEVWSALAQRVGDDAAVAAGRVGLQAQ